MVWLADFLNRFFRPPRVGGRDSHEGYSRWENEWGWELVRTYLEPRGDLAGKKVLDVGCGLGGKTVAYRQAGAELVVGADLDEGNVRASVDYASRELSSGWAFLTADASSLPFANESFDAVVANDAMEHFGRPEAALGEMGRVLRAGGSLWIFFTPYFSPLGSHLYDYIYIPWCHLLFSPRTLRKEVERVLSRRVERERVRREADKIMISFSEDLNRMSIARFERILACFPYLRKTYMELKPAKFRFLKLFTFLPLLRELFTGTVICRLEKLGAAK